MKNIVCIIISNFKSFYRWVNELSDMLFDTVIEITLNNFTKRTLVSLNYVKLMFWVFYSLFLNKAKSTQSVCILFSVIKLSVCIEFSSTFWSINNNTLFLFFFNLLHIQLDNRTKQKAAYVYQQTEFVGLKSEMG